MAALLLPPSSPFHARQKPPPKAAAGGACACQVILVEALAGIRELVSDCAQDMRANGEEPPQLFADRDYSGKFMVRVPPETHRALAIRAAEEGVSMNRLVGARLPGQR